VPWLRVDPSHGTIGRDQRLQVYADWDAVPGGRRNAVLTVKSTGGPAVRITVPVWKPEGTLSGFIEGNGCVAFEAQHYDRAVGPRGMTWTRLEDFGPTLGAVTAFPVTEASVVPGGDSPRLEYDLWLFSSGEAKVDVAVAPTLNFAPGHALRFGISWDDEVPRIDEYSPAVGEDRGGWARSVMDGARHVVSAHAATLPGHHVLKLWMVDPGVVFERVVVDMGGLRPSYLGPPESFRAAAVPPARSGN
jgi:hypothetical protein